MKRHRFAVIALLCLFILSALMGCRKENGQNTVSGDNNSSATVNADGSNGIETKENNYANDSKTDAKNGDTSDGTQQGVGADAGKSATGSSKKDNQAAGDTTDGSITDNSIADGNSVDGNTAESSNANDGTAEGSTAADTAANDEMSELMRLYTLTLEGMKPLESIDLPADSSEFSTQLASEALSLCSQGTKQMMTKMLTSSGFEILLQAGYDKDKSDPSHTCAFTLAKKEITLNGKDRDLLLISIRGTDSGEWFSNFDFAASHSDDTAFAENFLQAAQDVYVRILPNLLEYPDAVLLVCGHSRGAACANLLGMTLDDLRSKENVYVYTFATPGTVRGEYEEEKYTNIFNLINPADLVTYLPIAGWGYHRVGNDLILAGDQDIAARLKGDMDLLAAFVPTISDYYGKKHKIEGLEGFENGITAYETMLALASSMTGIENDEVKGLKVTDIYKLVGNDGASGGLYPLINFLKNMVGTDGNMNLNVFKQHMPAVYQELITKLDE